MFPLLPLAIKLASATTLMAGLFGFGLYVGHQWGDNARKDALIASYKEGMEIAEKQTVVTEKIVTKYVDRVKIVQGKSREIIKEAKVYVQDACTLSADWRLWHNNAVYNAVSDTARDSDEGTVAPEAALERVAANYGICHENSATLISLQDWVREQSEVK